MKNQSVLFSVLVLAIILGGCNLKAKRAKQYHDAMLHSVQAVIDSSLEYGDAIQSHQKTRAITAYGQYDGLVNKTIIKVENAGNFEGDTTLEHYSLEMLTFYKNTLQQQFKPFLDSVKTEDFNEAEAQTADSLYENLTMMENRYWDRFNWAERKFYKDNGMEKLESK